MIDASIYEKVARISQKGIKPAVKLLNLQVVNLKNDSL